MNLHTRITFSIFVTIALWTSSAWSQWKMHTIDDSSKGADGVRLADFNGDQRPDIVTGWEEGGLIRVYQNPGPKKSNQKWPFVTVGNVKSPEDAVFVDLDQDGNLDVISCCEGKNKSVFVHWAPSDKADYLDAEKWKTEPIPAVFKHSAWMFALPMDVDDKNGIDLVIGSKGAKACVGWLRSPTNPRDLSKWKFSKIEDAGWIMSLRLSKYPQSQTAILVSDRKGKKRGVYFLVPENAIGNSWTRYDIHDESLEYMFLAESIQKNNHSIFAATRVGKIKRYDLQRGSAKIARSTIPNPEKIQFGKAVAVGDIDLDGKLDLVHTSNTRSIASKRKVAGIHWLQNSGNGYTVHRIGNEIGAKFDRIELIDLDQDGDLDVLTCEEAQNLGVIWFENPIRSSQK